MLPWDRAVHDRPSPSDIAATCRTRGGLNKALPSFTTWMRVRRTFRASRAGCDSTQRGATIDQQGLSSDSRSVRASEEGDGVGDLVERDESSHRRLTRPFVDDARPLPGDRLKQWGVYPTARPR